MELRKRAADGPVPLVRQLWLSLITRPHPPQPLLRKALLTALEWGDEDMVATIRTPLERLDSGKAADDGTRFFNTFAAQGRVDLLDAFAPIPFPQDNAVVALWGAANGHHLGAVQWLLRHMREVGMDLQENQAAFTVLQATLQGDLGEHETFQHDLIETLGYPRVCEVAWAKVTDTWGDGDMRDRMRQQLVLLAEPALQRQWLAEPDPVLAPVRAILRDRAAQKQVPTDDSRGGRRVRART